MRKIDFAARPSLSLAKVVANMLPARCISLVLVVVCHVSSAVAGWVQRDTRTEPSVLAGIVHQHLVVAESGSGAEVTLDLAKFSPKTSRLHLIDNPDGGRALAEAMTGQNYAAGVNGGYFDESFAPLGLRIIDGKQLSPLLRGRLMTGVISSSDGTVKIFRVSEFPKNSRATTAIQCGPFLVDGSRAVPGLNSGRSARRTFVAATGTDSMLGFCSDVSLAELSAILAAPGAGLKVQRALNLDGGSSSGFWFKRKDGSPLSIPEQKNVRDFVAVGAK